MFFYVIKNPVAPARRAAGGGVFVVDGVVVSITLRVDGHRIGRPVDVDGRRIRIVGLRGDNEDRAARTVLVKPDDDVS